MIKQDISENQAKIAYLAIGSNLGNKNLNVEIAKSKLINYEIQILKSSSKYETLSWPDPKKPKFINLVLKIKTFFSAKDLMNKCHKIENELGKKKSKKNEPRIIDIDIIDYDQKIINHKKNNLTIPHPEMHKRNFVLIPFFEITKSWIHPIKKKEIKNLIKLLDIQDLRAIKLI